MKIEVRNLCKKYDSFMALDQINLTFETGMFGLLGANGAGKTTLIKILASILKPTSGKIIYNDSIICNKKELRKNIGYIPQKFSFYPNMTVFEVMDYFCALNDVKKKSRQRIDELLETVHLSEKRYLKTKELSGGMMQRLGIAVALICDPKLLLVDEPTVGLDPKERIHFSNVLTTFSKDRTILLSSHIVSDIEATCKNLAILNHGTVAFQGPVDKLLELCKGKVWEVEVEEEISAEVEQEYAISHKLLCENDRVKLRIVSEEKPLDTAIGVEPKLNDAYIYIIESEE